MSRKLESARPMNPWLGWGMYTLIMIPIAYIISMAIVFPGLSLVFMLLVGQEATKELISDHSTRITVVLTIITSIVLSWSERPFIGSTPAPNNRKTAG